jgi:hypothetical protein
LPSATNFDTIIGFAAGDVIDFASALTITAHASSAATIASIDGTTGVATFNAADDTLAEKITAVANAINASGNATAAGEMARFFHGGDGYIFISDGVAGVSENDVLIKLAAVNVETFTMTINGNDASFA